MATGLKFGSPEWRAMYMKPKSLVSRSIVTHSPSATAATVSGPKFGTPEWREKYQTKTKRSSKSSGFPLNLSKLEPWQIALLAAGGALALQHLLAPKGTSIASKILGSVGIRTSGDGYVGQLYESHCLPGQRWDEKSQLCVMTPRSGHCPAGMSWNERSGMCEPNIPMPLPSPSPSLGAVYTGAVHRGGFRGGPGLPLGPGPWPMQNAAAPDGNMEMPDPARMGWDWE